MKKTYAEVAVEMEKYLKAMREEAKRNPVMAKQKAFDSLIKSGVFINDACRSCPTHPRNGGTGMCNCILGNRTIH